MLLPSQMGSSGAGRSGYVGGAGGGIITITASAAMQLDGSLVVDGQAGGTGCGGGSGMHKKVGK